MLLFALPGLQKTGPAASPPGDTLGRDHYHSALTSMGCVVTYQKAFASY